MVILRDVRDSLKVLPGTLTDAHAEIYNRILTQRGSAPRLALNAFRWVLCSYEPLQSETLLDAVTVEIDGSGGFSSECMASRATDLLKACQNLLILDECLNVFRFAHLSAEEFLETQQLYVDSHSEIAKICLSLVCSSRSWMDYDATLETREGRLHDRHLLLYAAVFWPWHLRRCKDSCQILTALWEAFVSEPTFHHRIDHHCQRVQTADSGDAACGFGLAWKLNKTKSQFTRMAVEKSKFPSTSTCDSVQRGGIGRLQPCTSMFGDPGGAKHPPDAGGCCTPLHEVAKNGYLEVARLFVDRGADVSAANGDGWTPLHEAAKHGDGELARMLVDRGADVSVANGGGWTPLHEAATRGEEELARFLVERGADISAANGDGWTPLHAAAQNGHSALARLLVILGANVSAANRGGWTPLHEAAKHGDGELARMLVDRGADVSVANGEGWTPLLEAATRGEEELARFLVDRGAEISAANGDGWTPLHAAAQNGHSALARLLVSLGANVSASNRGGWTPLHEAAKHGDGELARMLVDRGADVSVANGEGWTPLHAVARKKH